MMDTLIDPNWTWRFFLYTLVAGENMPLLGDGRRRAFFVQAVTPAAITLNPTPPVSNGDGFYMPTATEGLWFYYRDWGPLVCSNFFLFNSGIGNVVSFVEVLYLG